MSRAVNAIDWYDTPLYYDIIFDADTVKETHFMEAAMRKYAGWKGEGPWRVLEPACGSGRLVAALAERGHEVCGFDGNANMLDYARQRLEAKNCRAMMWQDRLEGFCVPTPKKFDLAHCLVSTFKYLLDEKSAVAHLHAVGASLRKGGLYLLGLHLTDYSCAHAEHERWREKRDGIQVVCNTHTWPPDRKSRSERLRTRLKITREGRTWTQETNWTFRTYDARQLRALLGKASMLELAGCHGFDYDIDELVDLDQGYAVVLVLRKK